jgi:hypothetical protein
MSFDLQVQFSGLLHYIPNQDHDRKVRLCIALPEADNHHTVISARGNSGLELEGQSAGAPGFDRARVTFRFNRLETIEPSPFDYEGPMLNGEVKGVVPFNLIAKDSDNENPRVVSGEASDEESVRAQILLEEGVFFLPSGESAELSVTKADTGAVTHIKLSPKVFVRVENLDSAEIHVSPFENGPTRVYSIQPDAANQAEILVGYRCPDPETAPSPPVPDDDFRSHYQFLTRAQGVAAEAARPVPIITHLPPREDERIVLTGRAPRNASPRIGEPPTPEAAPPIVTAGGCDCAGWGGKALAFNLDEFASDASAPALRLNLSDRKSLWPAPPA